MRLPLVLALSFPRESYPCKEGGGPIDNVLRLFFFPKISGKRKAHKLKKSLGHRPPGGTNRGLPAGVPGISCCSRKKNCHFFPEHRPGAPGTPGRPGAFQIIAIIFSHVPFLLPENIDFSSEVIMKDPPKIPFKQTYKQPDEVI